MALATNDIDAIEQAAGEAMLAGFDGTLTLVMVLGIMFLGVDWRLTLIALLPFYSSLSDDGRLWWLWTCLAGFGLGLFGIEYCRRRRVARQERDEEPEPDPLG